MQINRASILTEFKKKAFKDVFISGLSTMLPVVEKYEWTSSIFDKVTGGQQ